MAINIFSQEKPVAHLGRNGFDLSKDACFSCRPSVIRPVCLIDTVPNSSYRISATDLVRTSALQTAAFMRGKQELDFYFIPYSMLYTKANNVIMTRGDDFTPALNDVADDGFPLIDKGLLLEYALLPYFILRYYKARFARFGRIGDSDWLDMFANTIKQALNVSNTANVRALICLNLFYDSITPNKANLTNPERLHFVGSDVLDMMAALGYEDYFLLISNVIDKALAQAGTIDTDAGLQNLFASIWTVCKACLATTQGYIEDVNPLRLAAYQKVWNDHYRDSLNDTDPLYNYASSLDTFNFDIIYDLPSLIQTDNFSITSQRNPLNTYLRPRRRMYERDLSVGLYNSTQFGAVSSAWGVKDSVASELNVPRDNSNVSNLGTSAYVLKLTFAMQKYREMLLRAGNRTKDVLRAEFGVKSAYIDEHYSRYLGSFDGALNLNKVDATSESGTYSVGDVAGNVFSSLSGNTIEFTCNDYGIIIGVLSFVGKPLHNAFGASPFVTKYKTLDFYHEAFANMGLKPVSSKLFTPVVPTGSAETDFQPTTLGFAACDFEYKQQLDEVYGSFCTAPVVPQAVKALWPTVFDGVSMPLMDNGINSNYVVVRPIDQTVSNLVDRVYQMPDIFDTIFKQLDGSVDGAQHFDVALSLNISAVLPMPVMGMF